MDASSAWLIATLVSAPIAGIVGFAIQLRTVNKLRLENRKLALEVARLERDTVEAERVIVKPSTDEVEKYAPRVLFSRQCVVNDEDSEKENGGRNLKLSDWLIGGSLLLLIAYFIYDMVRLLGWMYGHVKHIF